MHSYALLGVGIILGWLTLAAGIASCYKPKEEGKPREFVNDWWSTVWAIPLICGALTAAGAILYLICSVVGLIGIAIFHLVT